MVISTSSSLRSRLLFGKQDSITGLQPKPSNMNNTGFVWQALKALLDPWTHFLQNGLSETSIIVQKKDSVRSFGWTFAGTIRNFLGSITEIVVDKECARRLWC
eukprot:Blabericola_migrator_1__1673@NODE_144_length_13005_cov_119_784279_g125_i0_p14_GENE_NODE_144_length_13005_cov_119_784279_g125_i0NODE_144_length_13005_cov_119_784279_g125_i0_p14_ORF_typecomplete_len103_score14_13_NODE_144_length_13005_cov_119_784279_g125_i01267812986